MRKFGILRIYMYVSLPVEMHDRREKKITLAMTHCYLDECEKMVAEFKSTNPDIAERVYANWTITEVIEIS
jgi:hypothetical protein